MRLRKPKPDQTERRRSVTTSQPGVFSYYSQRPNSQPLDGNQIARRNEPMQTDRKFRLPLGYLPSFIALIALVVALLYSLWLQPLPRISLVNQPATVYRDTKTYQAGIEHLWRSSLLNQAKLTVHDKQLKQDILNQFPELSDVQIELPLLGRRPAVTLLPAKPAFQLVSGNGVFYVSNAGRVMARVTEVTKNQLDSLPLVRDETGLQAEPGKVVLPEPQAQFLSQLYAQLLDAKVSVLSITLPSNAANQADVRLTDKPYYIKFSFDSDPRQATGSYLAVREKLDAEGKAPVEYIDVRVEEKAFYR
jgi:hypothetical protein